MATVRYYGELAAKMGIKEESYPGATVSQVLSKIKKPTVRSCTMRRSGAI